MYGLCANWEPRGDCRKKLRGNRIAATPKALANSACKHMLKCMLSIKLRAEWEAWRQRQAMAGVD